MMWDMSYGTGIGGWGGMLMMGFFWLLVIAGFVLLVVWAVKAAGSGPRQYGPPQGPSAQGQDPAIQVARERYARGEISKEELDTIIRTLRS